MHEETNLNETQKEWHGTLKSYVMGLVISLILTGASFALVALRLQKAPPLIFTLTGLALLQAVAQVLFFLHLGKEARPRWETLIFLFMVLVVVIIAIGSLWIIYDLNHRVMM